VLILDTNIVSALVKDSKVVFEKYDTAIDNNEDLGISGITFYELQRGAFSPQFARKRQVLEDLMGNFELVLPDYISTGSRNLVGLKAKRHTARG
jgi:tRNA(fMet)-specific endonuclease VapC